MLNLHPPYQAFAGGRPSQSKADPGIHPRFLSALTQPHLSVKVNVPNPCAA
jgi:hypothetical protein